MNNDTFGIGSGSGQKPQLIPNGTLHFAQVSFKEIKKSQRTGGSYASIELRLIDGEHEGRKLFTIIMNPLDPLNRDEAKRREGKIDGAKMGLVSLTRMLETAGVFDPSNPESYRAFDNKSFEDILRAIDLKKVAIRIKISKGNDGYEDKNEVAEYLSPSQESGGYRDFVRLVGGPDRIKPASGKPAVSGAAPVNRAPAAQSKPAWLNSPEDNPF